VGFDRLAAVVADEGLEGGDEASFGLAAHRVDDARRV
jgi:hypothetical protein